MQTGSGKTHSIVGPRIGQAEDAGGEAFSTLAPEDGVLSRAFAYAFKAMQAAGSAAEYRASLTCSEIYNDQALLAPLPYSIHGACISTLNHSCKYCCMSGSCVILSAGWWRAGVGLAAQRLAAASKPAYPI